MGLQHTNLLVLWSSASTPCCFICTKIYFFEFLDYLQAQSYRACQSLPAATLWGLTRPCTAEAKIVECQVWTWDLGMREEGMGQAHTYHAWPASWPWLWAPVTHKLIHVPCNPCCSPGASGEQQGVHGASGALVSRTRDLGQCNLLYLCVWVSGRF